MSTPAPATIAPAIERPLRRLIAVRSTPVPPLFYRWKTPLQPARLLQHLTLHMLVPERHPSLMQADYRTTPKYQRRWLTLVVLSLSLVIIGMDNTILNVAIPTLQRDLAASASRLQWMVDSYILVFAGLLLVMGALGDRYGRASALRAGLLIFLVASLGAAYSRSSGQLIAARAVLGIGGALIMPATLSIITDIFPREERGRAIGIWAGVAGLGIGLGPLVGGFLLEHFWWGSVFLVNIPVVLIALALGPALVPQSRDSQPRPLDIPGAVLSIAAVATFVYTVIEAPARGWTDPIIMGGFVLTIVLGIGFARRELTTPHPMLPFDFFKNPRFTAGAGAISIAFFCLFGMIFGLTQYLQFVHGYSPFEAGLRTAPIALGMMIGSTIRTVLRSPPSLLARLIEVPSYTSCRVTAKCVSREPGLVRTRVSH